jgi:hypothetical protein
MKEKTDKKISFSTFFLIIAIIVIIVMGIFIYKMYNEKTSEDGKATNLQTQINNIDENTLVGIWNCTKALDSDNEEVSLREIFGSIVSSNGVGELTLNSDGTFSNYIGIFSSEFDDDTVGTYTISENTITLKCKSGKTVTLSYLDNQTIEYPYGDYTLILKK